MVLRSLIIVSLAAGAVLAQLGHRITSHQVVINSQAHWQNWSFPSGVLELGSTSTVQPHNLRRNINAVGDIVANLQARPPESLKKESEDIVLADAVLGGPRSNVAGVENLFDGDMATYWEPDSPTEEVDLGTQWWFIVDLGRLVMTKKIVLRFVEEDQGDPFLQFALAGQYPQGQSAFADARIHDHPPDAKTQQGAAHFRISHQFVADLRGHGDAFFADHYHRQRFRPGSRG